MDEISEAARAWVEKQQYKSHQVNMIATEAYTAGAKWALERAAKIAELPVPTDTILCFDTCQHIALAIRTLLPAPPVPGEKQS